MLGGMFLDVGGNFAIFILVSQRIWYIGVCGSSILGGITGGINAGCVDGLWGVKKFFIINYIFLLFLGFHCGGGGVGGNFAISQINMSNWSQWR